MKLKIFSMFAASLLVLGSCTEQEITGVPVQTGDEIHFGLSAPDKVDTKTVYDAPTQDADGNWYFPVYWEQDDEIAVYCPQASQPASQLVDYKITPATDNPATSAAVTKIGDGAGLQWGSSDEHRFYGFYPAKAVLGTETDGRIKGNIPVEQKVVRWESKTADDGTITYNGVPDTDLAYMFAYTSVKKSELVNNPDIPLKFKPLVTILEIIVNGPAENSSPIQVSNINVTGVSGNVALAGNFECLISDQSGTCTPLDNGTVTNRISISCFDNEKNQFITLNHGDKINVKAFIIPNEESIGTRQISITVSTVNGAAKTKTLQTAEIVPHKVNRVSLPALTSGGTNYWLSNLDPNIYLSELSLPGSKMSFSTKGNDGTEKFQTQSLETQFLDGVRAFVVQTEANTTYDRTYNWSTGYTYNVTGATVNERYTGATLESILSELKTLLDEAQSKNKKNEFAFVQITYNSASSSSYYTPAGGAFRYWIEGIEYELNQLIQNGNKYNIYTDQITPDTKLGDVGGHIVLKVNYNDGQTGMGQYIDANATIPALFSTWTKGMDDVALYWGSPNSNQTGRPEMHWYYSEATHIGNPNEAADLATKKNQISTVFQQSVDKYINGTGHNYWFMNDIGGCYSNGNPTIPELTADLNNYAVQLLQERTQNASLGIVLLNYADKQANSGALYQSDWLIQTIIDNNFKFALRKVSDTTNNAAASDASYSSGGNVIE